MADEIDLAMIEAPRKDLTRLSRGAAVEWRVGPFISGRFQAPMAQDAYSAINPADETILYETSVGDPVDVDAAVRAARAAFQDGRWSRLPPIKRAEILVRLADLVVDHCDELALLDCLEMGKPISAAVNDAGVLAAHFLRQSAGFADKHFGTSAPLMSDVCEFNVYEPRGVVGCIIPWNFPTANAAIKIGPALAAGNCVVLKPSEISPSSTLRLAELALEAGVPEGVLNVVPGLGSTVGEALALHPDVDLISFTGSTATGRRIMALAGQSNGKPLLLECGGKSPQIVFDDIEDLDRVAEAVSRGFLWNQGQVCSARTRLIAHAGIKDALLEKVIARACAIVPSDPLDEHTTFGPLASPTQRDRVKAYVDGGIAGGADPVLRGHIQESGGCYVGPTIFDRVTPDMDVGRAEIFGPVLCVLTFETADEVIRLANSTEYGLAATVWTRDMGHAKRLAHTIKAGRISIHTGGKDGPTSGSYIASEPQQGSGFGSESGLEGLRSYSTLKCITFSGV